MPDPDLAAPEIQNKENLDRLATCDPFHKPDERSWIRVDLLGVRFGVVSDDFMGSKVGRSRGTAPHGADETVYLVVDRLGSGRAYRETALERTDLEAIIADLLTGNFNDPDRVVAFNTLKCWANDVSRDIAQLIQDRCDIAGNSVPDHCRNFVDSNAIVTRQLSVPVF